MSNKLLYTLSHFILTFIILISFYRGKLSLKRKILTLDTSKINMETIKAVEGILSKEDLNLDSVAKKSKAASTFFAYLVGMCHELDPKFVM